MFLVCFSVQDQHSLDCVKSKWIPEVRRQCPSAPILLVGTKMDLRGTKAEVSTKKVGSGRYVIKLRVNCRLQAQNIAKAFHCNYYECSALRGVGLRNLFDEAVRSVLSQQQQRAAGRGPRRRRLLGHALRRVKSLQMLNCAGYMDT